MASCHYKKILEEIEKYFGVSTLCAQYLFHRALRSKRNDDNFLPWNVKLQNALIKADKCLGIVWEKIIFGDEEDELKKHGLYLEDMPDTVFKWIETEDQEDCEWKVVSYKKNKYKNDFTKIGLLY